MILIFEEYFFSIINKIILSENIDFKELEKRLDKAFDNNYETLKYKEFNSFNRVISFKLPNKLIGLEFSNDFIEKLNNKYDVFFKKEKIINVDKYKYNLFGLIYIYVHQNIEFDGFKYYFYEKNYKKLKINKYMLFIKNIFLKK